MKLGETMEWFDNIVQNSNFIVCVADIIAAIIAAIIALIGVIITVRSANKGIQKTIRAEHYPFLCCKIVPRHRKMFYCNYDRLPSNIGAYIELRNNGTGSCTNLSCFYRNKQGISSKHFSAVMPGEAVQIPMLFLNFVNAEQYRSYIWEYYIVFEDLYGTRFEQVIRIRFHNSKMLSFVDVPTLITSLYYIFDQDDSMEISYSPKRANERHNPMSNFHLSESDFEQHISQYKDLSYVWCPTYEYSVEEHMEAIKDGEEYRAKWEQAIEDIEDDSADRAEAQYGKAQRKMTTEIEQTLGLRSEQKSEASIPNKEENEE